MPETTKPIIPKKAKIPKSQKTRFSIIPKMLPEGNPKAERLLDDPELPPMQTWAKPDGLGKQTAPAPAGKTKTKTARAMNIFFI
jgi:hypothetical protein